MSIAEIRRMCIFGINLYKEYKAAKKKAREAKDDMKPEDMRAMVRDVNMGQVAPEERLSDQVFWYDGQRLSVAGEAFETEVPAMDARMESISVSMSL